MRVGRYMRLPVESAIYYLCAGHNTRHQTCLPSARITDEAYLIMITDNGQLTSGLRSWKTQR
jgi:hypothetical protein